MKITSFGFTLRQAVREDGYGDNYYVTIDENGVANVSHPYVTMNHKEQAAIFGIIQSAIVKYGILVNECDKANRALKLEQYAPKVSAEESAAPQSCALGDEEEDKLAILKKALESDKPLKGEESKELEVIVGE